LVLTFQYSNKKQETIFQLIAYVRAGRVAQVVEPCLASTRAPSSKPSIKGEKKNSEERNFTLHLKQISKPRHQIYGKTYMLCEM
jgi:hypothetical protein